MYGYFSSAVNAKSRVKHSVHDLSTRQVLPKVCPLPFHLLVHLDAPFQREPSPLHRPRPLQKPHGFVLVPGSPWLVSCGCSINSQMVSIAFRRKTLPLGLACIGGGGGCGGFLVDPHPPPAPAWPFHPLALPPGLWEPSLWSLHVEPPSNWPQLAPPSPHLLLGWSPPQEVLLDPRDVRSLMLWFSGSPLLPSDRTPS